METRAEALRQAREKRILLDNPRKWKITVWENLGWHWQLTNGNLTLYWSRMSNTFFGLLSSGEHKGTGANFWTTNYHSRNPNLVVKDQLRVAKAFVKKCQTAVDSVAQ